MAVSDGIATQALEGFADGASYDKYRPTYPDEAVDRLLGSLGLIGFDGAIVVDLAAGTGKFTEALARRKESFDVIAVEPHNAMRGELERKQLARAVVKEGIANSIPLEDASADALVVAQAFHWFANMGALREVYRVLKPGAGFGMIWNIEDYNQTRDAGMSTEWEGKLRDLVWTRGNDTPRFRHNKWRAVFDEQLSNPLRLTAGAEPLFSLPIGEDKVPWTVWLTKENLWSRYMTLGPHSVLTGKELEDTRRVFDSALQGADVEVNDEGLVAVHGVTYIAWTSRLPN
ncbi:S-adenosyl-L-methionine-dependent methyltransferase [Trichodelitschia bisporula]|uniref:S-adenosyl-L-methionine-dependent methyltransferase n=1 Tax=Trichodelitschia bisporula TaxID=703511 RepID=A0A6G1IAS7_9PEZI|nr:S-adenosyl-L-methionine-dependent methyltransferase [Trichodelitschia bisporula]